MLNLNFQFIIRASNSMTSCSTLSTALGLSPFTHLMPCWFSYSLDNIGRFHDQPITIDNRLPYSISVNRIAKILIVFNAGVAV